MRLVSVLGTGQSARQCKSSQAIFSKMNEVQIELLFIVYQLMSIEIIMFAIGFCAAHAYIELLNYIVNCQNLQSITIIQNRGWTSEIRNKSI